MAFLDNSGDIILDAVLTDTGRKLLARGDGSFQITTFAFGDDEVNYELFDATHASGSAYFDLNILQTPILEAFTNNTSSMKSKLITLSNNNLRYLPMIQLNQYGARLNAVGSGSTGVTADLLGGTYNAGQTYVALADKNTLKAFEGTATAGTEQTIADGTFAGGSVLTTYTGTTAGGSLGAYAGPGNNPFCFDQGIVSTGEGTAELPVGNSLYETQYLLEVDNRFFTALTPDGKVIAPRSFVDDDNVASYLFAIQDALQDIDESGEARRKYFTNIGRNGETGAPEDTPILGRTGSRFLFRLKVTEEIERSTAADNYLFTTFGDDKPNLYGGESFKVINTNIRVTGMTTGYRVSVPVQIVKVV